jgi:hypothetical protein
MPLRPEAIKNLADALWAVLRQQGNDPQVDLQALASCVIVSLAALKPESRALWYQMFTQLLGELAEPLLSGEQDPDEWLDRDSRRH